MVFRGGEPENSVVADWTLAPERKHFTPPPTDKNCHRVFNLVNWHLSTMSCGPLVIRAKNNVLHTCTSGYLGLDEMDSWS